MQPRYSNMRSSSAAYRTLDTTHYPCFAGNVKDAITTHYVKGGYALSDDVILSTTKRTRTIFRPGVHGGGVRGHIIRQKIGSDGNWKDVNEVNFSSLPPDCGVSIELDTEATQLLFTKLSQLYEIQKRGVAAGDQRYIVAREGEALLIDDQNKAKVIRGILAQGYSEELWQSLAQSNPDLATRLAVGQIQLERQRALREFKTSLTTHADEEGYWQKFFEARPWMLQSAFSTAVVMICGEVYLGGKSPIGRQGKGGVATDFLFADDSTKSFAVVDIKKPESGLVGPLYRGESDTGLANEVYSMHGDLSGGVVQVRNQIAVAIENFHSVLGSLHEEKINRLHPKGVLILGTASRLSPRQMVSFNQFRHGLHDLAVITYDELLNRLTLLFDETARP
jgi:hypothetical protein